MNRGRARVVALITGIAVVAAVALFAVGSYIYKKLDTITVTAYFDSAAGLYEDNVVAVVGMPVGKVTKIVPHGDTVEVQFTIDKKVKVPADVSAVTITTSILTDRQIELTPPYRGGPTLKNHDNIPQFRTHTPVAFDRVLDMLNKISESLSGDGKGGGPVGDLINAANDTLDGNGESIKAALGELSRTLKLSSEGGVQTRDQLTTIITDLSSLMEATSRNDGKLREFGSTIRQLSAMLNDEALGTGDTGRKINQIVEQATLLIDANRDNIRNAVQNGDTAVTSIVDHQRELAELLDVLPMTLENMYNIIDQNNGAIRIHALVDKILADAQSAKELCNLMHLRQLGCSTGTLQDYGPDFGLTYILDGLSMMGQ